MTNRGLLRTPVASMQELAGGVVRRGGPLLCLTGEFCPRPLAAGFATLQVYRNEHLACDDQGACSFSNHSTHTSRGCPYHCTLH